MDKIEYKRLKYEYQGRTIYEWEQSLEEVHMYIKPPPGVTAKMIDCKITAGRIKLGIKGNPPFMDVRRAVAPRRAALADPRVALFPTPPAHLFSTPAARGRQDEFEQNCNASESFWTMGAPPRSPAMRP